MKILLKLAVIGLLVIGATLLYSPAPALACSTTAPLPGQTLTPNTIAYRVSEAEVVFQATIINSNDKLEYPFSVNVRVENYFKGKGPEIIEIKNFGVGNGDCRSPVTVGETYIFYAKGNPKLGLAANYVSGSDGVIKPTSTNIAEVIAATGQQPTLPTDITPTVTPIIATPTIPAPTPTPQPTLTAQSETGNSNWLWVGLGIIATLGVVGRLWIAKWRRKYK